MDTILDGCQFFLKSMLLIPFEAPCGGFLTSLNNHGPNYDLHFHYYFADSKTVTKCTSCVAVTARLKIA